MNVRKLSISTAVGMAGILAAGAHADAPAAKWYDKVTLGGYVDSYYQQSINKPADNSPLQGGQRAFDPSENQFTFGGGELTLKTSDDATKTGYMLDLLFGPMADIVNSANSGLAKSNFMVGQAYVTKAMGKATFTMGKFATPIGTEVISLPGNLNFSRSILFTKIPYYHVGLKLDYALMDTLTLSGWVDDGNSVDAAPNVGKDLGFVIAYTGIKNLSLSVIGYENPNLVGSLLGNSDTLDVLAAYTFSDSLSANLEYLYQTQLDPNPATTTPVVYTPLSPKQQGVAAYVSWMTPVKNLSLIPRWEQYAQPDADNVTVPYVEDSTTITLKYMDGPLTHYLEYRADAINLFAYDSGNYDATATPPITKSQTNQTVTYAVSYGF